MRVCWVVFALWTRHVPQTRQIFIWSIHFPLLYYENAPNSPLKGITRTFQRNRRSLCNHSNRWTWGEAETLHCLVGVSLIDGRNKKNLLCFLICPASSSRARTLWCSSPAISPNPSPFIIVTVNLLALALINSGLNLWDVMKRPSGVGDSRVCGAPTSIHHHYHISWHELDA